YYHISQADAETRTNPLPDLYTVPVPGQTIFIRIEPVIYTDCYDITTVEIIVDAPPVVNPAPSPLVVCDIYNGGFASFFLHDADADITMGNGDLIVTYHPTLLDAQNDLNELPEPYNNDDPWNDVVFARIEDPGTDCFSTVALPLEVRLSPDLEDPSPYILCESDFGSGTAVFDLPGKEVEFLVTAAPDLFDIYYY